MGRPAAEFHPPLVDIVIVLLARLKDDALELRAQTGHLPLHLKDGMNIREVSPSV